MKIQFFIVLIAAFFMSCSSNVDIVVDNPSDAVVIVVIDSLILEVPEQEVVRIKLDKGIHTISLEGKDDIIFDFTEKAYLLNPTMSEYLLIKEFYGSESSYQEYENESMDSLRKVTFLGMELEGDYKVIKDLINPVTWEIGPREPLPEVVEVESTRSYTTVTKLMSTQEFLSQVIEAKEEQEGAVEN